MFKLFWRLAVAVIVGLSAFVAAANAQSSYSIKPGDVLNVEVLEDSSLNRQVLVLPDGTISYPMVGSVPAAGRTVVDVKQQLTAGLAPNFATAPNVFVAVQSLATPTRRSGGGGGVAAVRTMDVYVMGEVGSPGKKAVKQGTTLLQFLAEAGGLTKFAAEKRIELHRTSSGAETVYLFSYSGKGHGSRIAGSTVLAPGDVVIVPERGLFE